LSDIRKITDLGKAVKHFLDLVEGKKYDDFEKDIHTVIEEAMREERGGDRYVEQGYDSLIAACNDKEQKAKECRETADRCWKAFWRLRYLGLEKSMLEDSRAYAMYLGVLRDGAMKAIEEQREISLRSIVDVYRVLGKEAHRRRLRFPAMYRAQEIIGHNAWVLAVKHAKESDLTAYDSNRKIFQFGQVPRTVDVPVSDEYDIEVPVWRVRHPKHWYRLLVDIGTVTREVDQRIRTVYSRELGDIEPLDVLRQARRQLDYGEGTRPLIPILRVLEQAFLSPENSTA